MCALIQPFPFNSKHIPSIIIILDLSKSTCVPKVACKKIHSRTNVVIVMWVTLHNSLINPNRILWNKNINRRWLSHNNIHNRFDFWHVWQTIDAGTSAVYIFCALSVASHAFMRTHKYSIVFAMSAVGESNNLFFFGSERRTTHYIYCAPI